MKCFHRSLHADSIINEGFQDNTSTWGTGELLTGVWLSDVPLSCGDGGMIGDEPLLLVEIPEDVLKQYEWIEEGKLIREFLVPASLVNSYGPPRLVTQDEDDQYQQQWEDGLIEH